MYWIVVRCDAAIPADARLELEDVVWHLGILRQFTWRPRVVPRPHQIRERQYELVISLSPNATEEAMSAIVQRMRDASHVLEVIVRPEEPLQHVDKVRPPPAPGS